MSPADLHVLDLVPPRARPGDTVRVRIRIPHAGNRATPPVRIEFRLGEAFVPLAPLVVEVPPVLPGGVAEAACDVRVAAGADPAHAWASAEVVAGDHVYRTNVGRVTPAGAPRLDGPASGTRCIPHGDDRFRIEAWVENAGDASAYEVVLCVPPPPLCTIDDGEAQISTRRLAPGERLTLAYDARVVAPAERCETVATVTYGAGERRALPRPEAFIPAGRLSVPRVVIDTERRSARVRVELANDGCGLATDVAVRLVLPPRAKLIEGALFVDGVPVRRNGAAYATASREIDGIAMRIATIAPGATARIEAGIVHDGTGGDVRVMLDGAEPVAARLATTRERGLALRIIDPPRSLSPGESASLRVVLHNCGDEPLAPRLSFAGALARSDAPRRLAPGATGVAEVRVTCPLDADEGATVTLLAEACDGDVRATATATIAVEDRAWLAHVESERPVLRATGDATVHDVSVHWDGGTLHLGALQPGDDRALDLPAGVEALVMRGPHEMLRIAPRVARSAACRAELNVPDSVAPGMPVTAQAIVDVDGDADALVVAATCTGGRYAAGSTTVDGRRLLDRGARSPLEDGLTFAGVGAGTRITLRWDIVADAASTSLEHALRVRGDEGETYLTARSEVDAAAPFARRPPGFAYHIDALTEDALVPEPTVPFAFALGAADDAGDDALVLICRMGPHERAAALRTLRAVPPEGLAGHIVALRFFIAGDARDATPAQAGALAAARAAIADAFERVYVKLRIPGGRPTPDWLEDHALRDELVRAAHAAGGSAARAAVALADAPLGGVAFARTLLALVPEMEWIDAPPAVGAAVETYARALSAALPDHDEAFEVMLAHFADPPCDAAYAALVAALRAESAAV